MESGAKYSRSGGCLLAFSVMAGALIGMIAGQPSIGLLAGSLVGMLCVVGVFVIDRRQPPRN